ncbi:MAG TPA: GIY-YIG nuclease family protein [Halanaerobiales bacterium]|nr:GIY-YIG nuclease family protein [Halanaerobiales bacterium]
MHYVYIVKCADGTYYTGYTNNLKRRIKQHNEGEGAKYTKGRRPVKLVHSEQFETQSKAMQREYEIKQFKKARKIEIINQD